MRAVSQKRLRLLALAFLLCLFATGIIIFLPNEISAPPARPQEGAFVPPIPAVRIIGTSVEKRDIEVFTYGSGETHLLFVGGIHGGYEWNSVLLAYEVIEYLEAHREALSENVRVSIIPVLNPDGLFKLVGTTGSFEKTHVLASSVDGTSTRFNARGVDLNRNFACKWQPKSSWRGQAVSAGAHAFSEPEARTLRDFVQAEKPDAVVFWHSKAGAVYASECETGVLPETRALMQAYAGAAGYEAIETFDAYPITGDAEGWLASLGIPAITVELSTHEDIEWEQNKAGVEAVLAGYSG